MNKYIELVEKWLEDNNSVSLEELRDNAYAANAAHAYAAAHADAAYAAAYAAYAADAADAAAYVNKYKELTKEDV